MASEAETPTGEDVLTRPMASLDSREPAASMPDAGPTSPDERLRSLLEREEVEAVRGRLRRAVLVGLVGWGGFLLADFVTVFAFRDAAPLPFFSVRLGLIVVGVSVLLALDRFSAWTQRYLRIAELFVFVSAGLGVGALAALDRHGLASVHLKGTVLILLAHAVMLGSAWQRALVPVVLTALAPLVSIGIATMLSPTLEAQWRSPDLQDELLRTYSLLLGGTVLTLLGGHLVWGLRQQVAEARSIGRYRLRKRLA
ncbi:MAG: hypothetical protein K8H88_11020, partial [Sandaracinaceae bacterium]|nr:hypothetical protein [Sandaracinaceae bacterium]